MRLRKKSWADKEFEINNTLIKTPEDFKGSWQKTFNNNNPIHIEIGTGKGQFISEMSLKNHSINYIGIEKQINVISSALRKSREKGVKNNILFFTGDAKDLLKYFCPSEVSRIYINFCDPWSRKKKWAKRRITHSNFLSIYKEVLKEKGEIFFKTDNKILFEFSLNEFCNNGWKLKNISLDLHNSDFKENIKTEYEKKFSDNGLPIYRLEAYYK